MVSNVTYFVGLSGLPLADAVAVAYVSPLVVTAAVDRLPGRKGRSAALGGRHRRHGRA